MTVSGGQLLLLIFLYVASVLYVLTMKSDISKCLCAIRRFLSFIFY